MSSITEKWLSRKLVQSYVIIFLSYGALMLNKIGSTEWITLSLSVLSIYTYGNLKEYEQVTKG